VLQVASVEPAHSIHAVIRFNPDLALAASTIIPLLLVAMTFEARMSEKWQDRMRRERERDGANAKLVRGSCERRGCCCFMVAGISAPRNELLCSRLGGRAGRSQRSSAVGKGIGTATRKLREFVIWGGSADVVIGGTSRCSCHYCSDDITCSRAAPL
jgi:hypothetical protein